MIKNKNLWGSKTEVVEDKKDWVNGDRVIVVMGADGQPMLVNREDNTQSFSELAKARYLEMNGRA